MNKQHCLIVAFIFGGFIGVSAQVQLSFSDYMHRVIDSNIGYAAEQLNLNVAEAEIKAVKVFNDFTFSAEYANNADWDLMMGQGASVELSKTFSLGKRRANIDLAKSEKELTVALLDDYLRNLRADASISYFNALRSRDQLAIVRNAYQNIKQLADADSVRFLKGKISETNAIQSRLEAGIANNETMQAALEFDKSIGDLLLLFAGDRAIGYTPSGELDMLVIDYNLDSLQQIAIDNRADLAVAIHNIEVANRVLKVTRSERNTDFDISLGGNYNTRVRNLDAPAPSFTGFTVGISVPLKFSNFNKGVIRAQEWRIQQVEKIYEQEKQRVKSEVFQNYTAYRGLCNQVLNYDNDLLTRAKEVINSKVYAYKRGDCSLLEVLDAQRTYDDIQHQYVETLYSRAVTFVELQRSIGIIQ